MPSVTVLQIDIALLYGAKKLKSLPKEGAGCGCCPALAARCAAAMAAALLAPLSSKICADALQ